MRATIMKKITMRKSLFSIASFALVAIAAGACGELTGPQSPSTPTGVVAALISATSVTVTWTPSPLNDGVISYSIYRNGAKVGESAGAATTYTDTGLSPQTTYVYSVAANCVGGVVSDRSVETEASTVTTRDVTPPTVVQTIPVNGAVQASPSADVNVIFSEPMDPATINSTTFTLRITNGAAIAGTLTYNAETRRATIVPTSSLPNPASFTATVTTGAKDVAGNALALAFSWTFTTRDDTPPLIVSRTPINGATSVPVTSNITVTFSEPMDPATIIAANITLTLTVGGATVAAPVACNSPCTTATLDPTVNLASTTSYTITVTTGVKDVAQNALAANSPSTFTTADVAPPTVVARTPSAGATSVPISTNVTVTFSELMDPATINTTNITLTPTLGGAAVAAGVACNIPCTTATLNPTADLASATSYTIAVTTGVKDVAQNALAAIFTSTFTTADITAPTVSTVVPADNAINIATNATVRVTFSEPMDSATINTTNITLKNTATSVLVTGSVTYDAPTRVATFTPGGPLSNATNYTVNVTTGVKDASGNALASLFVSDFTTVAAPDNTAPLIVSRTPINGATSVPISTNVTVTFSEPMDPATINTTNITLTPTLGGAAVAAGVACNIPCTTATLDPTVNLASTTSYTITVTTGVKDVAQNALAANSPSTFTTADVAPPTVVARTPAAGATSVPISTNVTVTFSEQMDPATINTTNITLRPTLGGGAVAAGVACNIPCTTATLNPTADLANNTSYTITVTTGVKDVAQNAMAAPSTSTFTTIPDTTPPTVIARTPTAATGVAIDTTVTVTFSEAMDVLTINGTTFTLTRTTGLPLPVPAAVVGSVTYNPATRAATFRPNADLVAGASYTATVTTGAKDTAGNALTGNFSFSFTTAP